MVDHADPRPRPDDAARRLDAFVNYPRLKSFTAKKANAILKREGLFWAPEYFDRAIRDDQHYANALRYIEMNPVVAGLCRVPEEWRYGSAWPGRICASG